MYYFNVSKFAKYLAPSTAIPIERTPITIILIESNFMNSFTFFFPFSLNGLAMMAKVICRKILCGGKLFECLPLVNAFTSVN